jgi:hypothetical protein
MNCLSPCDFLTPQAPLPLGEGGEFSLSYGFLRDLRGDKIKEKMTD